MLTIEGFPNKKKDQMYQISAKQNRHCTIYCIVLY